MIDILAGMVVCYCVSRKSEKNLFRIANCYTIEGFCYSNGKMIRSMFVLSL